jgi:DNA adenine methylase
MRFLRYPGGKSKQLSFLVQFLPLANQIKGKYIEPFVGGGSVFLHVNPQRAIVSDLNPELIDLYKGVKNYPHKVWEHFESFPSGKRNYYRVRDNEYDHEHLHYRAARILYLNRTCFNGMWRHNEDGGFNVGYGGEVRRWAITHENIIDLAARFRNAEIINEDFSATLDLCSSGDFVFLDPPYKPGAKEMDTAHYINGRFSFDEQKRLAEKLKEVSKTKKIKWLMTNSSHPSILKLYKGMNITRVPKGTSNRVGIQARNAKEVLISNY